jgi:uncharacterized coiled-coil protein SlyX
MDERLERIENKLDRVVDTMGEINATTAKQQVSLDYHIKRTNLLENKLKPVEDHVAMVGSFFKLIAGLSGVAIIIGTIIAWLDYVHK